MRSKLLSKRGIHELGRRILKDDVFDGAAALAFYLTLGFFPALVVLIALVPYLPVERVDQAIFDFLRQGLPDEASGLAERVVNEALGQQRRGLLSFSILAAIWAASTAMYGIMRQINLAYETSEARGFIRARLTAIFLSLAFGALVLGAFTLIVVGGMVQDWLGSRFGFSNHLLRFFAIARWVIIVLAMLLGFALVYRFGPNIEQRFSLLSPGSVAGVASLIAVSLIFSTYIRMFGDYGALYGSIGAMIILMIWLYAAGFVVIVGAEINAMRQAEKSTAPPRE